MEAETVRFFKLRLAGWFRMIGCLFDRSIKQSLTITVLTLMMHMDSLSVWRFNICMYVRMFVRLIEKLNDEDLLIDFYLIKVKI